MSCPAAISASRREILLPSIQSASFTTQLAVRSQSIARNLVGRHPDHRIAEFGGRSRFAAGGRGSLLASSAGSGDHLPRTQTRCFAAERFEMRCGPFIAFRCRARTACRCRGGGP